MNEDEDETHLIHLGRDYYVDVNYYKGFTHIHIRKYFKDDIGCMRPTKRGVCISPAVWTQMKTNFNNFKENDDISQVISNDLFITSHTKDGQCFYTLQKLFQKKNTSFEFRNEFVVLSSNELFQLKRSAETISDRINDLLISHTLSHYVYQQVTEKQLDFNEHGGVYDPEKIEYSLSKCLTTAITQKITEVTDCNDTYDIADKFELFFERALYTLDWNSVAKDFVEENKDFGLLGALNDEEEFFDVIDVKALFKSIENMYMMENLFKSIE